MKLLETPTVSTKYFQWDHRTRTFTAEDSSLPAFMFGRVYDDACDVGFTMYNPKTNGRVKMVENQEFADAEGEVYKREFVPADPKDRESLNFSVIIYND